MSLTMQISDRNGNSGRRPAKPYRFNRENRGSSGNRGSNSGNSSTSTSVAPLTDGDIKEDNGRFIYEHIQDHSKIADVVKVCYQCA